MNLNRIIILLLAFVLFGSQNIFAENHNSKKKVIDAAKEITNKIESINSNDEDDVPLNDPFVGNTSSGSITDDLETTGSKRSKSILYTFKLVGIISGKDNHFISLANASGEVVTLKLFEELEEGLKLVDLRLNEAIFQKQKDKKYMVINFNNRVIEKDEY